LDIGLLNHLLDIHVPLGSGQNVGGGVEKAAGDKSEEVAIHDELLSAQTGPVSTRNK